MIRLEHIGRVFRVGDQAVHALDDVSVTFERGDYVSIMGPSGSGKSTLLNIIGLLDRPTTGRYRFDDQDVTSLSDDAQARVRRERIGFVFQFFHLLGRLTAQENVELPMVLGGIPAAERRRRARDILERMGLTERCHHRPDQLSGGQRQRVAIARAMVMRPRVLLADEPTGNLDRHSGREVIEALEALNAQGITLIVVTHDPDIGGRTRRQVRMVDGRITDDIAGPET